MREFSFDSPSPEATAAFARGLAATLRGGDVVRIRGALGAGKTTLVRAIAESLGIKPGLVSSPTFVVVNQYTGARSGIELVHVDAYRLGGVGDLDAVGWDRFFDAAGVARAGCIVLVEWPERIAEFWSTAGPSAEVELSNAPGPTTRRVVLRTPDSWLGRPGVEHLLSRAPRVCPTSGRWVEATSATHPFADERSRLADLNKWFTGQYGVSRPLTDRDLGEGA